MLHRLFDRRRLALRGAAAVLLLGGAGVLGACYPDEATSVVDLDTVATFRADNFNFGSVGTYALADSVVDLSDQVDDPIDLTDEYDALMLSEVRKRLDALGWSESDSEGDPIPDVVVFVGKVGQENISGGVWYPGYPGWGWWYPPCFGCIGWYPPTVVTYKWNTGTVVITMFDGDSVGNDDDEIDAVWLGGLNGVLSSSADAQSRIVKGINQAFDQSPYLSGAGS